jgi:hypothetical protein
MNAKVTSWVNRGIAEVREFGPYAAAELLLPGGSILAILLWLYRHHKRSGAPS